MNELISYAVDHAPSIGTFILGLFGVVFGAHKLHTISVTVDGNFERLLIMLEASQRAAIESGIRADATAKAVVDRAEMARVAGEKQEAARAKE